MTELELYKFLEYNNIEYRWEEEEFIAFIHFGDISEFAKLVGSDFLSDDGGLDCKLQDYYICLDLVPIAEYHDIDLENILKKD